MVLHVVFKPLERQMSEIDLVIKAKLAKVQFSQWRELMATALATAMALVWRETGSLLLCLPPPRW